MDYVVMAAGIVAFVVVVWLRHPAGRGGRQGPAMSKREIRCESCAGKGVVARYSYNDFEGPEECDYCGGAGVQTAYPSGAITMYPGGPLRGRLTNGERAALFTEATP